MKSYKFNLNNKTEIIKTHRNNCKFDFDEIKIFNSHIIGFKRNWEHLTTHNDIQYVKRLIIPESAIMISYMHDLTGETKNYLIYIDFGKYKCKNNVYEFYDLELDLLIKTDLTYKILDIDEMLISFKKNKIQSLEVYKILSELKKLIKSFNKNGIITTLKKKYTKNAIDWLIKDSNLKL